MIILTLSSLTALINSLPTTRPAAANQVWVNGRVLSLSGIPSGGGGTPGVGTFGSGTYGGSTYG